MKIFFLLTLFLFFTINAGREFVASREFVANPPKRLREFILRHQTIMTRLSCSHYSTLEHGEWYDKFQNLCEEVTNTKKIFRQYLAETDNRALRRFYNKFITALAEDKKNLTIANHAIKSQVTSLLNRPVA